MRHSARILVEPLEARNWKSFMPKQIGVPLTTLRNWEHDRREPLVSTAGKLARALGVSVDALWGDDGATASAPAKRKRGQ
jgi:DNA-binding XRE family transcriptional regulator